MPIVCDREESGEYEQDKYILKAKHCHKHHSTLQFEEHKLKYVWNKGEKTKNCAEKGNENIVHI